MVSSAAGLGALLHILGVAPLLECLPGHVLLDVLALLPGGGGALPAGGTGAILLVHILGDGGGDAAADLVRDVIAHFAGCGNIVTDLRSRGKVRDDANNSNTTALDPPAWGPGCTSCW